MLLCAVLHVFSLDGCRMFISKSTILGMSKCDIILWQLHPMWKCSQVAAAHGPDLGDANAPDLHDLTGAGRQPVQRDRPVMWLKRQSTQRYNEQQLILIL